RWRLPTNEEYLSRPTFDGDRAVIVGSAGWGRTAGGSVYAVDWAGGRLLWQTHLPGATYSQAAVAGSQILIGGGDGALYFLDREDGKIAASVHLGERDLGTPYVAGGLVFARIAAPPEICGGMLPDHESAVAVVDLKTHAVVAILQDLGNPMSEFS